MMKGVFLLFSWTSSMDSKVGTVSKSVGFLLLTFLFLSTISSLSFSFCRYSSNSVAERGIFPILSKMREICLFQEGSCLPKPKNCKVLLTSMRLLIALKPEVSKLKFETTFEANFVIIEIQHDQLGGSIVFFDFFAQRHHDFIFKTVGPQNKVLQRWRTP